jgi:hypothetical protein
MSILIDNFSMEVEEWVPVADLGSFSVDTVDHVNTIISGSSYFIHDGVQVVTTFSGITDGYRMSYIPVDVSSSGVISLVAHVQNDVPETVEQTFYLLYGYNAKFEEWVDWGPFVQVDIRAQATNSVRCPNTVAEGFYFITADLESRNLGATIRAIESVDLGASIFPQSTCFFYGSTYKVTVSGVKDFAGNTMDPYIFSFTIEDSPN